MQTMCVIIFYSVHENCTKLSIISVLISVKWRLKRKLLNREKNRLTWGGSCTQYLFVLEWQCSSGKECQKQLPEALDAESLMPLLSNSGKKYHVKSGLWGVVILFSHLAFRDVKSAYSRPAAPTPPQLKVIHCSRKYEIC